MHVSSILLAGIWAISSLAAPAVPIAAEPPAAHLLSCVPTALLSSAQRLQVARPPIEVEFLGDPPSPKIRGEITWAVTYVWMSKTELSMSDSATVASGAWHSNDWDKKPHATVTYSDWPHRTHVYKDGSGNLRPHLGIPVQEEDARLTTAEVEAYEEASNELQAVRPSLEVEFLGDPPSPKIRGEITNAVTYFWMSKTELTTSDSATVASGAWHHNTWDPTPHATVTYSNWPYRTHVYQNGSGNLRPDLGIPVKGDGSVEEVILVG